MIDIDVATRLRDQGLEWQPADGDHFVIDIEPMRSEVFMLSSMVVERGRGRRGEQLFRFNGTTEWALDSIEQHEAVWIPREDQLREALGERFVAPHRATTPTTGATEAGEGVEGAPDAGEHRVHVVSVEVDGTVREIRAPTAEDAYAGALLVVLTGS
ncbi:hypothetical protein ACT3TZ_07275 [Brachybacterium sp. AOP25-B2-12]|uniref:hypothetical protein n=1 Tax=Brachybacterium sp. AOP25-B2-12 TaxID=3457710 RepID=UPI00403412ED